MRSVYFKSEEDTMHPYYTDTRKRLISLERYKSEGLEFVHREQERPAEKEGEQPIREIWAKVVDAAGNVYDGVLMPDGWVDTDFCKHGNDAFGNFKGPAETLCSYLWHRWRYQLLRDANGELYQYRYHTQVSMSDEIWHISTPQQLAEMFLVLEDVQIIEFASGHWTVNLPEDVREEIENTVYYHHTDKNRTDLIAERLRRKGNNPNVEGRTYESIVERLRSKQPAA
jgi:hypothetical protein